MIIQAVLIALVVALCLYVLQNRNTMRLRAGKKILFVLFVIAAIFTILDPNTTNYVARLFGVGRGADLLLYLLVIAFAFVTLSIYLKFKDYDEKVTRLARQIALSTVEEKTRK